MTNTSRKLNNLVLLSLFVALVILLGLTPLGLIPLGFINVTILCVPVIVGALYMGPKDGLVLGLSFGAVSFYGALTRPSSLVATLMGKSPVLVFILCFLPRILVPLVACLADRKLAGRTHRLASSAVAAALGSLTNTVLYLGLMLLFYIFCGIDTTSVLALIGGTALIAGSCEALAAAILVPPVLAAVSRIGRSPRLHHAK